VWVEEAAVVGPHALTAHALLARLPQDPATVARMRANVAAIYRRYFASPTKRADAFCCRPWPLPARAGRRTTNGRCCAATGHTNRCWLR